MDLFRRIRFYWTCLCLIGIALVAVALFTNNSPVVGSTLGIAGIGMVLAGLSLPLYAQTLRARVEGVWAVTVMGLALVSAGTFAGDAVGRISVGFAVALAGVFLVRAVSAVGQRLRA